MEKIKLEKNWNLSEMTSWKVGGEAEYYCAPENLEQLKSALVYAQQNNWPVTILGGGTNALISDQGVSGLVIHMIHLNQIEEIPDQKIYGLRCLAGALKSDVLKYFLKARLDPAVFLAGLPGDMGGGVVMNAGVGHDTNPKEFCEIVKSISVFRIEDDGKIHDLHFNKDQINWEYRRSHGWQPGVIYQVEVQWPQKPDESVLKKVREGNKRRKGSQPLSQPSCGSVFKNPPGDHAGRLIEASGLKGLMIGGAQVSEKHANFIVNLGEARATDIHELIEKVQAEVEKQQGVRLTNEVVYLGRWPQRNQS